MPKSPTPMESAAISNSKLISVQELSSMLGMSKRTVWRLLSAGQVPQPVRIGRNTRWRLDQVCQWIDSGCPAANNYATDEGHQMRKGS